MIETYYIHDNGGRPFVVYILFDKVFVCRYILDDEENENDKNEDKNDEDTVYQNKPILEFVAKKIFVGKSPVLEGDVCYGGQEYGSACDGNIILLHIKDLDYVYIGCEVYSFTANSEIVKFVSPIGANNVPYPYAIDNINRYYMLLDANLIDYIPPEFENDPYRYYYNQQLITDDLGYIPPVRTPHGNFYGIKEFYIGGEPYTMTYDSNPEEDYDRIANWDDFGKGMEIVDINDKRRKLTRQEYIRILNDFGELFGIEKLKNVKILQERL